MPYQISCLLSLVRFHAISSDDEFSCFVTPMRFPYEISVFFGVLRFSLWDVMLLSCIIICCDFMLFGPFEIRDFIVSFFAGWCVIFVWDLLLSFLVSPHAHPSSGNCGLSAIMISYCFCKAVFCSICSRWGLLWRNSCHCLTLFSITMSLFDYTRFFRQSWGFRMRFLFFGPYMTCHEMLLWDFNLWGRFASSLWFFLRFAG